MSFSGNEEKAYQHIRKHKTSILLTGKKWAIVLAGLYKKGVLKIRSEDGVYVLDESHWRNKK